MQKILFCADFMPILYFVILLEFFILKFVKKTDIRFQNTLTNLNFGFGYFMFKVSLGGLILISYEYLFKHFSILNIRFSWYNLIFIFFVYDFLFYLAHRVSHEVNFLWAMHSPHHQSEDFNLSVAARSAWFHGSFIFIVFMLAAIIGFEPKLFFSVVAINVLVVFIAHTSVFQNYPGFLNKILVTPKYHSVHHACNPQYINKNHGSCFIIWDKMFGTFADIDEKPVFGVTEAYQSWDPVNAHIQPYADLIRITRNTQKWQEKIKLWFAFPGYIPESYNGPEIIAHTIDAKTHEKFEPKISRNWTIYVTIQFSIMMVFVSIFLEKYREIDDVYKWLFIGFYLISSIILSKIQEGKTNVLSFEVLRIAIFLFCVIYQFQIL
ncbi:MAG: sterol desaturase family protein [Bacteroidetes bacterium]|jgi:sterol desaturase/sphingolipid hydroxylase (fatty acid hydroxylase superfamily)|nr:sterol desaturase family protein [Bacteroidota bacterium]MBP7255870.1 sterol desaturase family protein [Chitinophagales bacterium]MBK7139375.1 sterol desaturase family protein [Bacteroidota bacterium]MBK7640227.1 sterol desaturase family protein [Bacteroidota bacterium]MBK8671433.1 sterol desaturase family protein [Bacteroidota bacterium]